MNIARFGALVSLSTLMMVGHATPTLLIYQAKAPKGKDDPNIDITSFLSKEYETNGRLTPIVLSPLDPTIKAALTTGRIKPFADNPRNSEVFALSRELRVDYLLVVESIRVGKSVKAKLKLFRSERQIYHDDTDMSVSLKEIMDPETTARSIAHTFAVKMDSGPFKAFPDQPKIKEPTLQPGQAPTAVSTSVKITPQTTDVELRQSVDALVKANRTPEAVLKLRDAVDASPFDFDRRTALIELLQTSSPLAAAQEARRAALLMPDKVEFRVLSARAWVQAGQPAEAQKDLNEAIARDPNGAATRVLLAELSLNQLDPTKALAHLDAAIKQQDSGQARFLRAICRSLLGGTDGMLIDLAQADKLESTRSGDLISKRYAEAVDILDKAFNQDGVSLRSLIPKIVVKPTDQNLRDDLEQMLRLAQARTTFLSSLPVPTNQKLPQDQRILAHKLLIQSLLDVQGYRNGNDEDTLAEARINLGEALKHLQAAQGNPPH